MSDLISEHNAPHVLIEQQIQLVCGYQVELVQKQRYQLYSDGSTRSNKIVPECPPNTATFTFTPPTMRIDGSMLKLGDIASYTLRVTFFNGFSAQVMATDVDGLESDWSKVVP